MSRQLQFLNRRQSQRSEPQQARPRRAAAKLVMPKRRRPRRMHVNMGDVWSGMSAFAELRGNGMVLLLLGATIYAMLCFIIFVL